MCRRASAPSEHRTTYFGSDHGAPRVLCVLNCLCCVFVSESGFSGETTIRLAGAVHSLALAICVCGCCAFN